MDKKIQTKRFMLIMLTIVILLVISLFIGTWCSFNKKTVDKKTVNGNFLQGNITLRIDNNDVTMDDYENGKTVLYRVTSYSDNIFRCEQTDEKTVVDTEQSNNKPIEKNIINICVINKDKLFFNKKYYSRKVENKEIENKPSETARREF